MKKYALLFVLAFSTSVAAFADVQVRIKGETSAPFSDRISVNNVVAGWDDSQNVKFGFGVDVVLNRVGFTESSLSQFQKIQNAWICDFEQLVGVSLHLFDLKVAVDPYLVAGLGCAGQVDLENGARRVSGKENLEGLSLALFPYLGFGVALNLDSIVFGTQILYHPRSMPIPAAPIDVYPLRSFECGIYVGIALGSCPDSSQDERRASGDSFWRN